jgi:PAS domain S-box-containing protein
MIRGQLTRDDFGKPIGMSGVSLDIADLKMAGTALVESEARFEAFAQAMPNQVWSATPDGLLDWFNDKVFDYGGLDFAALAGTGWAQMVHPDDIGAASASWAKALSDAGQYQTQFRLRRADGAWRWHLARALPIKDQAGAVTRWVGTNTDIEDQKALEAQQTLLTGELEHRIKNTLAMVAAIASQTFRTAATKEDARDIFDARLNALNKAHQILTSTSWTGAPLALVVEGALASHRSGEGRIKISGPTVQLPANKALSLSLALHELATNATKYGALSVSQGTIDVAWGCSNSTGSPLLHFEWRESGGPVVLQPTRRGFGSRLIERTLSSDLGGSVAMNFDPTGLVCKFDVKLSQLEAA